MNQAFEIGGIGLETQQKALDVIANNIANLNTPAFKRSDVRFSDLVTSINDPLNPAADLGAAPPSLAGVSVQSAIALNQQGELQHTGDAMDVAIDGVGFIELMGPRGQTLLWRGGALNVNDDGLLAGPNGLPLRAMIPVPTGATSIAIAADGSVSARSSGNGADEQLGRITLVQPADTNTLERLDGGLYRLADDVQLDDMLPGDAGVGALVQGSIERSNVDITNEMVRLMIVQRAYGANAQVIQAADQMMAIANNLRR